MLQRLKIRRHFVGAALLLPMIMLGACHTAFADFAMGYSGLAFAAPQPGSYKLPVIKLAADGVVLNAEGNATALHDVLSGKNSLLAFIYSNCKDANGCPLAAHVFYQLKVAMQDEPELARGLQLISLSFDPQRDTPELMKLYSRNFQYSGERGQWHFLTTSSEAALAPILAGYGQQRQRELSMAAEQDVEYSHLLRVFLIDANLQVRNVYSVSYLHPDLLKADVHTLLLEQVPSRVDEAHTNNELTRATLRLARIRSAPLGLPPLEEKIVESHTSAEVSLGRRLFFDRRLSFNSTFSCAMCHVPSQGFGSNELRTSVGVEGRSVRRNAPSLFNVAHAKRLFHDGRGSLLEEQIWGPLLSHNEMANPSVGFVMDRLRALPVYRRGFQQVYGEAPSVANLGRALAAYQRSLNSGDANFDRWYFAGEESAVDSSVKRGFELFRGKANCASCHIVGEKSAVFSDWELHNTGTGYLNSMGSRPKTQQVQIGPSIYVDVDMDIIDGVGEPRAPDLGRYEISQDPADLWKYRTPSLRNVALSAPYMHDGSLRNLADVLTFYNKGGQSNKNLSPLIKALQLNESELRDIEAFLLSLTGNDVEDIVRDALAAPVGDPGGDGVEGVGSGAVSSGYQP